MMKIAVANLTAHALADAARGSDTWTATILKAILVRPDGMIAGTDGYTLAWHPHGVTPYDGEALAIVPPKFPKKAKDIVYNADDMTVTYTNGHKQERAAFTVLEGTYPDFERVTPTKTVPFPSDTIGVNPQQLVKFHNVLNVGAAAKAGVKITYTGERSPMIVHTPDQEQRLLVMPLNDSTKAATIPWLVRGGE